MPGLYDQRECTLQQRERDMWLQRCRHTYSITGDRSQHHVLYLPLSLYCDINRPTAAINTSQTCRHNSLHSNTAVESMIH